MVDRLPTSSPIDEALRASLPAPSAALTVRVVEGLRVLVLRHLTGGAATIETVLADHGLGPLPKPGACHGGDPWLLWAGPAEYLLLATKGAVADSVLHALAPGREALSCALDQSAACLVLELLGHGLADVLPRLLDASAIPQSAGQGGRTRLVDIPVVHLHLKSDRSLLAVDRTYGGYAVQWIREASKDVASPSWPCSDAGRDASSDCFATTNSRQ